MRSPDPSCRAILVYGTDAGLVAERAVALAQVFVKRGKGQTEIVRLDDRDLAEDPARLEVELKTAPMFATQSVIRVTAGQHLDVQALKALLATPSDNALIVEAGNLKTDSGLRKLFEAHKSAAALPCYSDVKLTLGVIDAELAEAGLSIDRETRDYLMTRLGADQALSRSEVVKLALYAQGAERIEPDDIDAIVGDAAETALDNFAFAVSSGDAKAALIELQRLAAAGTGRSVALTAVGRHFTRMHRVAVAASSGGDIKQVMKTFRPPLHFSRQDALIAHCKRWGASRLSQAMPLIQEAVRRTRRSPDLEGALAERLVLTLTSRI
jgi:DNA polymerase-3 subunit delta